MLERFQQWLHGIGLTDWFAQNLSVLLVQVILVLLAAWLSDFIVKRVLHRVIRPIIKRSRTSWDDAVVQRLLLDLDVVIGRVRVGRVLPMTASHGPAAAPESWRDRRWPWPCPLSPEMASV